MSDDRQTASVCPPAHQPIADDDIAWIVVTLYRDGSGQVSSRSIHLRDEDEAHEVATLLSNYGPTWMLGVGFEDSRLSQARYGMSRAEADETDRSDAGQRLLDAYDTLYSLGLAVVSSTDGGLPPTLASLGALQRFYRRPGPAASALDPESQQ